MIDMSRVEVSLAGQKVLAGADLEVKTGETVALIGVSGCGKSTLLRAAVGLVPVDAGAVRLAGEDLGGASRSRLRELRRKVGMLFQGNALFDSMTVAENIGFSLKEVMGLPRDEVDDRVNELLNLLELGPIGKMFPSELSGGMKKRVGIARAIAHDPEVVLLDDPTAGLDPVTSLVIADLIAGIGGKPGRAMLMASNHLPLIARVAGRIALLREGRVENLGPAGQNSGLGDLASAVSGNGAGS